MTGTDTANADLKLLVPRGNKTKLLPIIIIINTPRIMRDAGPA